MERKGILRVSLLCMGSAVLLLAIGLPLGILLSRTLVGGSLRVTLLNLFFTGALGATLLVGTSRWRWLVQWPILRFFGEISYGLYLIHMLVFDVFDHVASRYFPSIADAAVQGHFFRMLARFTIAAGVAVGIAFLSRRTFEARFLSLKDRWTVDASDSGVKGEESREQKLQIA